MKSLRIVTLVTLSACAFKNSAQLPNAVTENTPQQIAEPAHTETSQDPSPTLTSQHHIDVYPLVDGKTPGVKITRSLVTLSDRTLTTPIPFVIDASPPKAVRVEMALPSVGSEDISLSASWSNRPEGSSGIPAPLEETSEGYPLSFVTRVPSTLTTDDESFLYLIIQAKGRNTGGSLTTISLLFATPPSKVKSEQLTVQAYERKNGSIDPGLRVLRQIGFRTDLLQVISLTNQSWSTVSLTLPAMPKAKLHTDFHRIDLQRAWCKFSTQESRWNETLSSVIYMVPIDLGSAQKTLEFLNAQLQTQKYEIDIPPGQSRLIGVYGSGAFVDQVSSGTLTRSALKDTEVTMSCKAYCAEPTRDIYAWNPFQADLYLKGLGYPGASKTCAGITMKCDHRAVGYDAALCTECAGWELSNGTAPWDHHRFCWSPEPGNSWGYPTKEMWIVERTTAQIKSGLETFPVILEFDPAATEIPARYRFEELKEPSPVRTLRALINPKTIQME